jgi:hypothetical protein
VQGHGRLGGDCRIAVRLVVDAIPLGEADDRDRVRKVMMIGAGAVDQKAFTFQPFDGELLDACHPSDSSLDHPPGDLVPQLRGGHKNRPAAARATPSERPAGHLASPDMD